MHWQPTPDGGGYWALTRHADVAEVSRDPERFSSARGFVVIEPLSEAQLAMMRFTLLGMDPPEHLRFRRLLQGSFTPQLVAALEPRVREIARAIFARAAGQREVEFVEDVAGDAAEQVFGEMLGVPAADRARVRALGRAAHRLAGRRAEPRRRRGRTRGVDRDGACTRSRSRSERRGEERQRPHDASP